LSRHRKIQLSRSSEARAIVITVIGVFSVAAAAAAAWTPAQQARPDGSAAVSGGPHQAVRLTVTDQLAFPIAEAAGEQGGAVSARHGHQVRLVQAQDAITRWKAAQQAAAATPAASQSAATPAASQSAATPAASQSAATPAASQTPATTRTPATTPTPAGAQPTRTAAQPTPAAATAAPSGSPQQIAKAMLGSFGWSSSQFSCLDPLWAHESGWGVTAYNAGSGAYGIPQALPGSRMASVGPDWRTNAATQIKWGLEYIKGSYGSPCGAWAHEQATGWY